MSSITRIKLITSIVTLAVISLIAYSSFTQQNTDIPLTNDIEITEVKDKPLSQSKSEVENIDKTKSMTTDLDNDISKLSPENLPYIKISEDSSTSEQSQNVTESAPQETIPAYNYNIDLKTAGIVSDGVWDYTWYSSNTSSHYRTSEWHTNEYGFWCDSDGYLVVASSTLGQGEIVETPWGVAKVYDSGCAANVIDMYVNW